MSETAPRRRHRNIGNWKNGERPHHLCGAEVEDHLFVDGEFQCPPPPEELSRDRRE